MSPPRQNPSNGIASIQENVYTESPKQPRTQRHRSQPSVITPQSEQSNLGMSPASRYNHNLKVLRRRDPSIVSIFDQFSHVCVYHHNGNKWEKQGFEGSMFLYERDSYPPYGFYILNRMGMDDYIHRLYPEDDIGAHGSYLMLRSYPEFTAHRLNAARASTSNAIPDKFSDVYAIPNLEKLEVKEKGRSQIVGLWMFATDAREPMIDVMIRLHSYIKKNAPYPEEFRYGPDRPPPPNPHLRTTSTSPSSSQVGDSPTSSRGSNAHAISNAHAQGLENFNNNRPSAATGTGSVSELDKLFAKLAPPPGPPLAPDQAPTSTSKMTVESLFAVLSGSESAQSTELDKASRATLPASSTGISLLDSIFASANTNTNAASAAAPPDAHTIVYPGSAPHTRPPTTQPPSQPETIMIYSPTPTTTTLPQILNQDVISTLLGLPPSRSASVASTAYSSGARSHPSSREGDNEGEGEVRVGWGLGTAGSDGGYSESSTVLDPDAEFDEELQAAGASAGRPLVSANGHPQDGYLGSGLGIDDQGRINGDVTPRAPMNGFPSSFHGAAGVSVGVAVPTSLEHSLSTSTIRGPSVARPRSSRQELNPVTRPPSDPKPNTTRPLVPFEADSELWPYPRAPLDDRVMEDEIVELDFEDTRALSDPDVFRKVLEKGRKNARSTDGSVAGDGSGLNDKEKANGKGKKKGKKERAAERAAEREREREEIERSWDVPVSSVARAALPRSEVVSPPPPTQPSSVVGAMPNGVHIHVTNDPTPATPPASGKGKKPQTNGTNPGLNVGQVKDSVIAAVFAQAQRSAAPPIERNEFVREVLTLIHTDKAFVDTLWRDYVARLG